MNCLYIQKYNLNEVVFNGGAKEAKLELLISNLIAKFKTPKANAAFFEINHYLRKQKVA